MTRSPFRRLFSASTLRWWLKSVPCTNGELEPPSRLDVCRLEDRTLYSASPLTLLGEESSSGEEDVLPTSSSVFVACDGLWPGGSAHVDINDAPDGERPESVSAVSDQPVIGPGEFALKEPGLDGNAACDCGCCPHCLGDHKHFDVFGNEYDPLDLVPNDPAGSDMDAGPDPAPFPTSQTFQLHSNAGSNFTIYLDFDGHVTSGTSWNSSFTGGQNIVTPAYDFDGIASSFSTAELDRIQFIWQRVSEDFSPFDVNVTTQDPGTAALARSGTSDTQWGVRVVVGGGSSDWYGSSVGGVAYVGSFNWQTDTPAFVFENDLGNGNEKYTAEAISHEVGHSLGLSHDGTTSQSYYSGHGSGDTGWAPIMGSGYSQNLTQWSRGQYSGANNTQDDLLIITSNNGFGYRLDDHGGANGTATSLTVSGSTVASGGIIERTSDIDVFTFSTTGGTVNLTVNPFERGPNLDILAELYDAANTLIASSNPLNLLDATISTAVSAGQYFLHVGGVGKGDPLSTGYSDYGSLGQYFISGSVPAPSAVSLSLAATDANKLEGDAGTTSLLFTVTRGGDTTGSTSVGYSVSGDAINPANGADFSGGLLPTGTITFAAGETTKSISVQVAGDTLVEADERFTLQLTNASGGAQISSGTATGIILNDDVPPPPGITVTPGNGGSFSVRLNSQPTADVRIAIASSNTNEITTSTAQLVFTTADWNMARTVTLTGLNDSGYARIRLVPAISADATYNGMDPDDILATNELSSWGLFIYRHGVV
jgi:hypothetical protein